MLGAHFTSKFKKDVKRLDRRHKDLGKLSEIVDEVIEFGDAPASNRPHNLTGDWAGFRECHIEPDWLLIFTLEPDQVVFHRTGTHSDLFK